MIELHKLGLSDTLYELGRIASVFGLIAIGIWIVIKVILRSGKRRSGNKPFGINREQRRAELAKRKRKRRQSAHDSRRDSSKR